MKSYIGIALISFLISNLNLNYGYAQTWSTLGTGTNAPLLSIGKYNGKLVFGGNGPIGNISEGVATWDGTMWDSLGPGIPIGLVRCFANYNNDLIVAGDFYGIGNITMPNTKLIAAWNGVQWYSLGLGGVGAAQTSVYALAAYNGELYVGGSFMTMGGISCNYIARWNGSVWNTVGSGVDGNVYSMCVFNGELYAGGSFQHAGGIPVNAIARWDGIQWDSFGNGAVGLPLSMIVDSIHNQLVIGGTLDTSSQNGVYSWDGSQYHYYGNGLYYATHSLSIYNNYLFATIAPITGTINDTTLVYWDSTSWRPIIGSNDFISEITVYNNELYIAGSFTQIDTLNIPYVARYSNPSLNIDKPELKIKKLRIFPNPSTEKVKISFSFQKAGEINLRIYDSNGTLILSRKIKEGTDFYQLDTSLLAKGIYLVSVQNKKEKFSEKFVVE